MTNFEFIMLKASDGDIAQWLNFCFCESVYLFGDEQYTDFNKQLMKVIWGCKESIPDFNVRNGYYYYNKRFINIFMSLKYDKDKWDEWIKIYDEQ